MAEMIQISCEIIMLLDCILLLRSLKKVKKDSLPLMKSL